MGFVLLMYQQRPQWCLWSLGLARGISNAYSSCWLVLSARFTWATYRDLCSGFMTRTPALFSSVRTTDHLRWYVHTGIQEGQDTITFWLSCENNVRVNTVDVSCELFYVVFMDLGERVIHISEPQRWGVRCSAQRSFFEHLHVQAGNNGGHW